MCEGGARMSKPKELLVNDDITCELSESMFAYFHDQNDKECYENQLVNGNTCGCPATFDASEIRTVVLTQRSAGILSLFGSLFTLWLSCHWGSCTMCEGGARMSKPKELLVNDDITCELSESMFAYFHDQNDKECYENQLVNGNTCGCPATFDASEIRTVVLTQRSAGILSLFGSLFIIMAIITKPQKVRWSTYNQIVLNISFFDALSSTAYIIGTAFTPKELALPGSIGNAATCGFQGWLFQIGIASVYYSLVLWVYFLLVVKYNWTERKFSKVTKWVHLGVVAVALIMAFAVIHFVSPDYRWLCYLASPHGDYNSWAGVVFFIIPVARCMIAMTVLTVIFVRYVLKVHRKTQSKTMQRKGRQRRSLASRTVWQSVWFLLVFYAVWLIQFAAFSIPRTSSNYWLFVLPAIFAPLQGFLNALVVFCRDRKSMQRRVSQSTKKLLSLFSTTFTSAGSSEVVSAELAEGRETKQPVEYSVESETAAQLEIGVGQLDRPLEEKENTPEAASSGEEDESDDDFDENDEGLLEHAINADLLNDDDRKNFRVSIARIQGTSSRFTVE